MKLSHQPAADNITDTLLATRQFHEYQGFVEALANEIVTKLEIAGFEITKKAKSSIERPARCRPLSKMQVEMLEELQRGRRNIHRSKMNTARSLKARGLIALDQGMKGDWVNVSLVGDGA